MKFHSFRKYLIFSISFLLIPAHYQTANSCAGYDMQDVTDFVLFNPKMIGIPKDEPFFLSVHDFYPDPEMSWFSSNKDVNLSEWSAEFPDADRAALEWMLYTGTVAQTKFILDHVGAKQMVKDSIIPAALLHLSNPNKWKPAVEYLLLAKQAEIQLNEEYYSWDQAQKDTVLKKKLTDQFFKGYKRAKNDFLKSRYAYQSVRACYANQRYQDGIDFGDKIHAGNVKGSMHYRLMGYIAGCYYQLGKYVEANKLFARIYDEYPPQRYEAFISFNPYSDSVWNTLIAQSDAHQKEVMWQLYGVKADAMKAIDEILKVNPSSQYALLPLVRTVNIIEESKISPKLGEYYYYESPFNVHEANNYDQTEGFEPDVKNSWEFIHQTDEKQLTASLTAISDRKNLYRRDVWKCAAAYVNYLTGNVQTASKLITETNTKDSLVIQQNAFTTALVYVADKGLFNKNDEAQIYKLISPFTSRSPQYGYYENNYKENAARYILEQCAAHYPADDIHRTYCNGDADTYLTDTVAVNKMISYLTEQEHNDFEKLLIDRYPVTGDQLYDVLGSVLLQNYEYEKAVVQFKKIKGEVNTLGANPFTIHIWDCHDCDRSAVQKTKYTKLSFTEKLIELRNKAESSKDNEERAKNSFLMANGLYNMTYFGNCRDVESTRLTGDYTNRESGGSNAGVTNKYYDCNEALKYYQLSDSLSKQTEFKAKCTWMSAKCENNMWEAPEGFQGDFEPGVYFQKMKEKYADTRYFKEAIQSCGYFCTYITKSPDCIRNKDE